MADELLENVRDALEGQIDFEGQRLAELLTTALLAISGIIAFLYGYIAQDIASTLYIGLGGAALTFLAVVPPWPLYNKHPIAWLPRQSGGTSGINIQVNGKKVN
ncbi:microsomal signal peptidase-like protein 12 kDa subunit [Pseudovirgaria hyperparasitica]|uniref:Signal peptidase complex subunit 1 n=1 Tax=Pseudovirgaria hyperparasitica TaxID=470096 RepID=A0A6A6VZJ5_9PEZI|nr:microsomal signal peptidase-like protein 12 kDa subunit [Pseudovirgaria hyperparasitica]KAF2756088.1 microsomal signal peptidase-like protein 12 kDa subunit [Pseudovirgaria hyperparasitica]